MLVATISDQPLLLSTLVQPASLEHVRYTSLMFQYLIDLLNRTNSHRLTDITGKKQHGRTRMMWESKNEVWFWYYDRSDRNIVFCSLLFKCFIFKAYAIRIHVLECVARQNALIWNNLRSGYVWACFVLDLLLVFAQQHVTRERTSFGTRLCECLGSLRNSTLPESLRFGATLVHGLV